MRATHLHVPLCHPVVLLYNREGTSQGASQGAPHGEIDHLRGGESMVTRWRADARPADIMCADRPAGQSGTCMRAERALGAAGISAGRVVAAGGR